jgi:hypothetical protein
VFVLVTLVVAMSVGVSKRFVLVLMLMFLGQMQPYTEPRGRDLVPEKEMGLGYERAARSHRRKA